MNFGVANSISVSAPGRLQLRQLRGDVGCRVLVRLRRDDRRALPGDRPREAARHVLAELRVLEEDGDPRLRASLDEIAAVDAALAAVALEEANRPRVLRRRRAERLGAVCGEDLGDLLRVEVVANGEVVRRPDGVEDRRDPVLLDELAGELNGLRRVVRVVVVAVLDLAAVDAAAGVDPVEVRLRAGCDRAEGGCLAGERDRSSDQDGRGGDARVGGRSAAGDPGCDQRSNGDERERGSFRDRLDERGHAERRRHRRPPSLRPPSGGRGRGGSRGSARATTSQT